ncbi:MAG: hypothetical protein AAF211_15865 [Myxococcota bacterium]
MQLLSSDAYRRAVALRDLTDPRHGDHAMQLLLSDVVDALTETWSCRAVEHRANPVVPVEDNYDRLHYPPDGAARAERYTRYVSEHLLLRTQTSAMVPDLLRSLGEPVPDTLLVCPGLVYRRDTIDRLHTGEPHQVDLWRIRSGPPLDEDSLQTMIERIVEAALPGHTWRCTPADHPYTVHGRQIDVAIDETWVEVGECGLALPVLLEEAGLDPDVTSGLAMGLGLDRLLMLRKAIDDIRLLRSSDPRVAEQMYDLAPYCPVSVMPATVRDLSLVLPLGLDEEDIGDQVRNALGAEAVAVESIAVVGRTGFDALPVAAIERLELRPHQENVLLRVVLRHPDQTLTTSQANRLRNRIYRALHRGPVRELAPES